MVAFIAALGWSGGAWITIAFAKYAVLNYRADGLWFCFKNKRVSSNEKT